MALLSEQFLKRNTALSDIIKIKPFIGVGIINFNGAKHTLECIENVAKSTRNINASLVIAILDNGSNTSDINFLEQNMCMEEIEVISHINSDDFSYTINICKNQYALEPLLYIKSDKNLGFCTGYNLIAKIVSLLGAEYLLVLNNDARIEYDTIELLVKAAKQTQATVVSPLIKNKDGQIWYIGGKYYSFGYYYIKKATNLKKYFETDVYSGCCALFYLPDYLDLKGMRDSLFICLDEPDFSRRIKNSGNKIYVEPRAHVIHIIGAAVGRKGSRIHNYFWVRNRFLYSQFNNNKLLHFLFVLIYSFVRIWKWLIYLRRDGCKLIKIDLLAFMDFLRHRMGPGSLWNELNSIPTPSELWHDNFRFH